MRAATTSAVTVGVMALCAACAGATRPAQTVASPPPREVMAQLWVDPGSTPRDLVWGIGGREHAPAADAVYRLKAKDESGFSVSYDVTDPQGLEWSVKIGPEAQTEVVVSRLLWALGYHQPPVYYLSSWTLEGEGIEKHQESQGRFRPKLPQLQREEDYWRWADNPFSGSHELKGLLVVLLMFNSTDLKDDNNSIYRLSEPWDGASRWFVVRDLGASLGETGKIFPRRNWLEGFEKQGFIKRIDGESVEFDYDGLHQELLSMITPADVQWAAGQMQRLTDAQWHEAFRAAGYSDPFANRYIVRLRQKIDDGAALRPRERAGSLTAR
jgi:hypothetical protein